MTMTNRMAMIALLTAMPIVLAGCDDGGPAKRQLDAARGRVDTSYPGPPDEKLTEEQRSRLRERGQMQR